MAPAEADERHSSMGCGMHTFPPNFKCAVGEGSSVCKRWAKRTPCTGAYLHRPGQGVTDPIRRLLTQFKGVWAP